MKELTRLTIALEELAHTLLDITEQIGDREAPIYTNLRRARSFLHNDHARFFFRQYRRGFRKKISGSD